MRIPFDSLTLRAVADELRREVVGGAIQRVSQPSAHEIVLDVRLRGHTVRVLASCDAVRARVHLTWERHPRPSAPPAFCMLCRKWIEGASIVAVEQRGFDRIADLRLRTPAGDAVTLAVEIMGKHSNLVLIGPDGAVLDAAKRVNARLSRFREVLPGVRYVPPPPQAGRADPFAAEGALDALAAASAGDAAALAAAIQEAFAGISPFLARELAAMAAASTLRDAWREVFGAARAGRWSPSVAVDAAGAMLGAYPLALARPGGCVWRASDGISRGLDAAVTSEAVRGSQDAARAALEGDVRRALRSIATHRDALQKGADDAARMDTYRENGELLLAQLHTVPEGASTVALQDYYTPGMPDRVIALDPRKSARENAEAWFRRYRKARDGVEALAARLALVDRDMALLREAAAAIAAAADVEAIQRVRDGLRASGALRAEQEPPAAGPAARTPDFDGKRIRTMATPDGWTILYGENAEANDHLTRRVAAPNDLWLHVRANTSSHVVIRTGNRPEAVPQSVVRLAAAIAVRHSAAKHSSLTPVDCTLAKFVRKPRGAAPGTVTYRNERTVYVSPDDAGAR